MDIRFNKDHIETKLIIEDKIEYISIILKLIIETKGGKKLKTIQNLKLKEKLCPILLALEYSRCANFRKLLRKIYKKTEKVQTLPSLDGKMITYHTIVIF